MKPRLTLCIAIAGWASFFILSWLIILYDRFQNGTSILFWMFFLIVAFAASVSFEAEKKDDKSTST